MILLVEPNNTILDFSHVFQYSIMNMYSYTGLDTNFKYWQIIELKYPCFQLKEFLESDK